MPADTPDQIKDSSPVFLGLQYYTEAQSGSFFGRDKEIDSLSTLVMINTLTIVFGRSGTGKTSLLNAGVFPKLRKNYCLPFRIRLEFNDKSPDVISQIKKSLKEGIINYNFKAESFPGTETLWEYFHKEPLWKSITPILVFDQFEEIFTLAKSNPRFTQTELPAFWEEMSNIIENTIPEKLRATFLNNKEQVNYNYKTRKAKVVFSFREEYLPEFESIASKIPSIKYSRFRLLPMNGHQALEVITKNWKEKINPAEANKVVDLFVSDPKNNSFDTLVVEPALLSQVCAFIDKERIEEGGKKVSPELLMKYPKVKILRHIYEEAVIAANNALPVNDHPEEKYNRLKEFLEENLLTTDGFRSRYHLTGKDEVLRPGIDVLNNKYFIREDDRIVELTHDVVAPIIKADRDKRRKLIALADERRRARKKALVILLATLLLAGGFWLIAGIKSKQAIDTLNLTNDSLKIAKDSLHRIDSIILEKNKKDSPHTNPPKPPSPGKIDSGYVKQLQEENKQLLDQKDSLINSNRSKEEAHTLETQKLNTEIKNRQLEINRLRDIIDKTPATPPWVTETIDRLNGEISRLKNELEDLKRKYKLLDDQNKVLKGERDRYRKIADSLSKLLGNASLIGKLYYQNQGNDLVKPSNIPMYLIPIEGNRRIVRNASVYEINCYEKELKEANGVIKTTTDVYGNYRFVNVPKGEYLLKICTYYGGFYTVKVDNPKIQTRIDFNASPPVRYPYTN